MATPLQFAPYVPGGGGDSTSASGKSSGNNSSKGVKRDCGAAELDK